MTPFIIAFIVFILFCMWVIFAFGATVLDVLINGIIVLLIGLRSYRDVYHHKEARLYAGCAAASLIITAAVYPVLKPFKLWLLTEYVILAFAVVYIVKLSLFLDKKYKLKIRNKINQ